MQSEIPNPRDSDAVGLEGAMGFWDSAYLTAILLLLNSEAGPRGGAGLGPREQAALSAVKTLLLTHPTVNRKEAGGISSHTVSGEGTLTIFHLVASPWRVWSSCLGFVSLSSLEQFLLARGHRLQEPGHTYHLLVTF